jgi:hypothetical protein
MNASISHKPHVKGSLLDELAKGMPAIIADVMQVTGGNLAIIKPEQIALEFSQASQRDIGPDLKVMVFAKNNAPRTATENDRAKAILAKMLDLITKAGEAYSVDVRLYLMEIGAATHGMSQ